MINARRFTAMSSISHCMAKRCATSAKPRRIAGRSAPLELKLTRMKKRWEFGSPNCALSTILQACSSRNAATPATMPIRSGQESRSTPCIAVQSPVILQ